MVILRNMTDVHCPPRDPTLSSAISLLYPVYIMVIAMNDDYCTPVGKTVCVNVETPNGHYLIR